VYIFNTYQGDNIFGLFELPELIKMANDLFRMGV